MTESAGRPRVLVTRRLPETVEAELVRLYDTVLSTDDLQLTEDVLCQLVPGFTALVPTITDPVTERVLDAGAGSLRIVANFGAGYNNIDLNAAHARGVVVSNTPGVLTEDTADIALALILMTARRLREAATELHAGEWTGWRPTHMLGASPAGKTLGILGFGRIGEALARKAHLALGMQVLCYSRTRPSADRLRTSAAQWTGDLELLLGSSDFVSIHVPGNADTRHMLDARLLSLMRPSAVLINTARGDIVDEGALIEALASGRLAAAGLDVFENEPQVRHDLLSLPCVVALPHIGSATVETRTAMGMRVLANLAGFFGGGKVGDRVV